MRFPFGPGVLVAALLAVPLCLAQTLDAASGTENRSPSNADAVDPDGPAVPGEPLAPVAQPEAPAPRLHPQRSPLPLGVGLTLAIGGLAGLPLLVPALRWALLLGLFSRLGPADLLENANRGRILDLLRVQPGLGIKEVCERLSIGWGNAVHHLTRLEKAGIVVSHDAGRYRRFFHADTPAATRTALCVLTIGLNRRLLAYVREHPGTTQQEACRALGLSAPLVHKYAQRLRAEGLLETRRQWRTIQYYAAESVASHLEEYARLHGARDGEGLAAPTGVA